MATPEWNATRTWTTGEVPTATQFNDYVRDDLDHLVLPASAQATRTTNLSVTQNTDTALTLPAENWDTDGFHSTSSNTDRFTVPAGLGGIYLVQAEVLWAGSGDTSSRRMWVQVNGTDQTPELAFGYAPNAGITILLNGSTYVQLAAGDYCGIEVRQSTSGALNVTAAKVTIMKVSN